MVDGKIGKREPFPIGNKAQATKTRGESIPSRALGRTDPY